MFELLTHEGGLLKALNCLGKAPNLENEDVCDDIAGEVALFADGTGA